MIRALQWSALALAFIVLAASSSLRLAANGLSCAPWPVCYGQTVTADAAQAATSTRALRAIHRVAATVFGLLVLALALRGWRHFSRAERLAALLLLGVTIALAWLGRYTPSPLPAVTVANVLGGLALVGLLTWMLAGHARVTRRVAVVVTVLGAALALQAADGALISARLAGAACTQPCERAWLPGAAALWDLARAGSATDVLGHQLGGQPLYAVHALAGMALLPLAFVLMAAAGGGRAARRLLGFIGATVAVGVLLHVFESPLWLAVVHAILASGTVAAVGALLASDNNVAMETIR